ncbi:MAG: hypothetical protein Q8Q32_00985 [bacterium]|nr:hypothetical protein [bacterium]
MSYVDYIGIVGATIILIFFLLDQTHKVNVDSKLYDFFNFLGGGLLTLYGILIQAWPFVALNAVWPLFSLRDLLLKKK